MLKVDQCVPFPLKPIYLSMYSFKKSYLISLILFFNNFLAKSHLITYLKLYSCRGSGLLYKLRIALV
jgi:hypothetical protein